MNKQGTLEKRRVREALLSIYDEVAKCNKCGFCLSTCPVYTITGEERAVARGHNVHLQNLIEGNLEMSQELKAPLFECLLCRACVDNCMSGVMTHENVLRGRSAYMEVLGEPKVLQFVFRKLLPNPKKMDFYVRLAALGKKLKASYLPERSNGHSVESITEPGARLAVVQHDACGEASPRCLPQLS